MTSPMNCQSLLSQLDDNIQKSIIEILPSFDISYEQFYDTCIQYFISQSNRNPKFEKMALQLSFHLHSLQTKDSFVETMISIQSNQDIMGQSKPILHSSFYQFILDNKESIESLFQECVKSVTQFSITYFGWKTLYRSYLLKNHNGVQERIEHLFFRVALFLYEKDFPKVKKTFQYMMNGNYIHATPTLYHAGLINPQMASCFLVGTSDSVTGIYKTISDAAIISKYAGGIGIHISNIRGENSYIHGTNGISNGIMPMLRVYNATSRYIDQCFDPNTLILCSTGWKSISTIIPNVDKVLTHDNTFQTVLQVIKHPNIKEGIVSVNVETPLGIQKVTMTNQHDLLMTNEYSSHLEENFVSLSDAPYGSKTIFIDPYLKDHKLVDFCHSFKNISDWFYYGYICGHLIKINDLSDHLIYTILFPSKFEMELLSFCEKYKILFTKKTMILNDLIVPNDSILYELSIEYDTIIWNNDNININKIPSFIELISKDSFISFMKGYLLEKDVKECSFTSMILQYRLGMYQDEIYPNKDICKNIGKIESITPIDKTMTLYDLEINTNHNYQTMIGLAHNGGGKRKGAFAMYLEPWHNDILAFIKAKRNIGHEEERARDLFYGLWICDYFMEQVECDGDWYLFSDVYVHSLQNVWGNKFKTLYLQLVQEKKYTTCIKARELWVEILKSQIETGTPYILYKDTCNKLSNQQNIGTIKSSNLCCEIIEYSDDQEYAVCNLASISLKSCLKNPSFDHWISIDIYGKKECFYCSILLYYLKKYNLSYQYYSFELLDSVTQTQIKSESMTFPIVYREKKWIGGFQEIWKSSLQPSFDFNLLKNIVHSMVENLNVIIDKNYYPLPECKQSNFKHRPIGIGVQGLADVFMEMLIPYESEEAQCLNHQIFEHLYFYALEKSNELAKQTSPYQTFNGSPLSKGQFHFDLYNQSECNQFDHNLLHQDVLNWNGLRHQIQTYGVKNSLLIAPMPTASTSQILGNTESFEPLTSNYYVRRTNAGEFYIINSSLKNILIGTNLWNEQIIDHLILNKGSVQSIKELPMTIKNVFKTVWEMSSKILIDMASTRQYFIDQSQSFNLYLSKPDMNILNKIHFYGWKKQLKTGSYYLRTRSALSSQNFTIDPNHEKSETICESCSA